MNVTPIYKWTVEDGIVKLNDQTLSEEDSLLFLLEQSDAPATTYVHRTFVAQGLAVHVHRLLSQLKDTVN